MTQEPGDAAAVLDAARAGWRAGRARAEGRDLELDPQLEEALRSLGYAP